MRSIRLTAALVALFALSLSAAACGDAATDTTTPESTSMSTGSGVEFGRGSVPDTVPESFPVPDEAVIGATLVDSNRGLTEMILTFPATVTAVVKYYDDNLPARGYEIARSEGTDGDWEMTFSGQGVDGEIRVKAGGSGVSSATVQLTAS